MVKSKTRAQRRPSRAPKEIIRVSDDADRGMFLRQFKDHVVYGVSQTNAKAAIRDFIRLKHFVEVELPEIEGTNKRELLVRSAEFQKTKNEGATS